MYAKFKIKVLNNCFFYIQDTIWAFKMLFTLIIFYWSAMDDHSKREVLEIFNMN